jgi:hypothetical protein
MSIVQAFTPLPDSDNADGGFGDTIAITIGAANVATLITTATQSFTQWRFYNSGTAIAFVSPGLTAALAVAIIPTSGTPANGFPIAPGEDCILTVPPNSSYLGVIGSAANGTLYVTVGEGV